MIVLSREPGGLSLYQQLYRQLRGQIARGEIQAGQKLPAKRAMAQRLNISVNTVDGPTGSWNPKAILPPDPGAAFMSARSRRWPRIVRPRCLQPPAPVRGRAGGGGFLPRWNRGGEIPGCGAGSSSCAPARRAADPQPHPRRWGPGPAQRDLPVYF